MIVIYGKKRVPQRQISSGHIQCPHCLQTAPIIVVGCVEYFHLYYVPFFGWKSVVYQCSDCQKNLKEGFLGRFDGDLSVQIPAEVKALSSDLLPQVGIPWYYFSGLIIIVVVFGYVVLSK